MELYLFAFATWLITVLFTSWAKSKFSWTKTKLNWTTNHKASLVSTGVSFVLTAIAVLTGGFSVPSVIGIVTATGISEVYFNRAATT